MEGNKYVLTRIKQLFDSDFHNLFNLSTQIIGGGFMVCTDGNCDVVINAKSYNIKKWDLIVLSPYSIIQLLHISQDFNCSIIGAGLDYLSHVDVPNKGDFFITINSHPSISLNESEVNDLLSYKEILLKEENNEKQPFFEEIHKSILKIAMLKIFAIYSSREPNREVIQTRNSQIFNTFIFELLQNIYTERKLDFYAQKQSITPSHLSRCVKNVTGKNASDILIDCVINNIKYHLHDTQKSITQISELFHFYNTSSFSQYFKKYTSMTPREYRKSLSSLFA